MSGLGVFIDGTTAGKVSFGGGDVFKIAQLGKQIKLERQAFAALPANEQCAQRVAESICKMEKICSYKSIDALRSEAEDTSVPYSYRSGSVAAVKEYDRLAALVSAGGIL